MPQFDVGQSTTTNLSGVVQDVKVRAVTPDQEGQQKETFWDYPDANQNLGYYQDIPEINSALHVLAQRVAGLGYTCESDKDADILENLNGVGKETFDEIIQMLLIESKVFGDSFAEIVRSEQGTLINLKKLYAGNMRVVWDENGLIDRYEYRSPAPNGQFKKLEPSKILNLSNRRIANQIHGTSIVKALKKIIDAKNQALTDEILIRHRDKALGIAYYKTDNTGQITFANSQIEIAVNKGEMLGLPEDTVKIEQFPSKNPSDRIAYLQYLDNLFYQVVGTPKVLVTSEGYTEAGGKAGLLAFEPTEISEKRILEQNIWNQLAIRIKFDRSPSLLGEEQSTQSKNAGQTGIQPNETEVTASRTE